MSKEFKRICILSDGTWQSHYNDEPTNILRLSMALRGTADDGVQQIVFYDPGVGTLHGVGDKLVGGLFGEGIDLNIQELYSFLSLNYEEGDEVYLFGYSRGAYTVRSLGGLISCAGLVRQNHVNFVKDAYELYRRERSPNNPRAVQFRKEHGSAIPIKLLACFDTVGSLGIPITAPGYILNATLRKRYDFHDTKLSPLVENAVHILSAEEQRGGFTPTLMQPSDETRQDQVTQLYFWGNHEGVGGGHMKKRQSAFCALRSLVEIIRQRGLHLSFFDERIPTYDLEASEELSFLDVASDTVFNTVVNAVTGEHIRKIKDLNEVHPSAISRYLRVPSWRPKALLHLHHIIMEQQSLYM